MSEPRTQSAFEQFDAQVLLFSRSYLELVERQTDAHIKDALGRVLQAFSGLYQVVRESKDVGMFKKKAMMPKLAVLVADLQKHTQEAQELVNKAPNRVVGAREFDAVCRNYNVVLNELMVKMRDGLV